MLRGTELWHVNDDSITTYGGVASATEEEDLLAKRAGPVHSARNRRDCSLNGERQAPRTAVFESTNETPD